MLAGLDPPVGVLHVVIEDETGPDHEDRPVVEFTGWLGLLHALYEATGSTNQPGTGG